MPRYEVASPDGRRWRIDAPEGATREEVLRRARDHAALNPLPAEPEPPGLTGGLANAVVRGAGRVAGALDASGAETWSAAADARAGRDARFAAGTDTWLDRLGARFARETPEELRGRAAGLIQSQAERNQRLARDYPMTEGGLDAARRITAGGFWEGVGEVVADVPSALSAGLQVGAEQALPLAAAAGVGALTKNPAAGIAVIGGSSYLQERHGQAGEVAARAGLDLSDPDGARAYASGGLMEEAAARGRRRGGTIAAVDMLTLGLTSKLPVSAGGLARATGLQVAGGAGGEAAAQVAADGRVTAPGEVVMEALAEGAMAPADVAALAASRRGERAARREAGLAAIEEEARLAEASAAELERRREIEAADARAKGLARLRAAPSFVPWKEFRRAREAARLAGAMDEGTESGAAFRDWLVATRSPSRPWPRDAKETEKEAKAFLKENAGRDEEAREFDEYNALLDRHAAFLDARAARSPGDAAAARSVLEGLLARRKAAMDDGDAAGLARINEEGEAALLPGEWLHATLAADGAIRPPPPAEGTAAPDGASPPAEAEAAPPPAPRREAGRVRAMREHAEAVLGPGWMEDHPDIQARFENRTGFYKKLADGRFAFQEQVDRAAAEKESDARRAEERAAAQEPPADGAAPAPARTPEAPAPAPPPADAPVVARNAVPANPGEAIPPEAGAAPAPAPPPEPAAPDADEDGAPLPDVLFARHLRLGEQPSEVKLSESEKAVYELLRDAAADYRFDEYFRPDGKLNATEVAEAAGLASRQAANTAFKRLRAKTIAALEKSHGVTEDQLRARLREQARLRRAADSAPEAVLDPASLGKGFSTKASANQGAYEGVAEEDAAWTRRQDGESDLAFASRRARNARNLLRSLREHHAAAVAAWGDAGTGAALSDLGLEGAARWLDAVAAMERGEIGSNHLAEIRADLAKRAGAASGFEAPGAGRPGAASAEGPVVYVHGLGTRPARTTTRFSRGDGIGPRAVAGAIELAADALFGTGASGMVRVHAGPAEARAALGEDAPAGLDGAKAFIDPADGATAHFIASAIAPEEIEGVLLHEIGVHAGLEARGSEAMKALADEARAWAGARAGSAERRVHDAAMARMDAARADGMDPSLEDAEMVAYAVEEASRIGGEGGIKAWLARALEAVRAAVAKWSGREPAGLSAADLVEMAKGAGEAAARGRAAPDADGAARFSRARNRALGRVMGGEARAAQFAANVRQAARTPLGALKPISRFVRENRDAMPSAGKFMDALYEQEQSVQAELIEVDAIANAARRLAPPELARLNDFVSKSTFYQLWGYDPGIEGVPAKVDPVMAAAYKSLSPEARDVARRVFAHGEKQFQAIKEEAERLGIDKIIPFGWKRMDGPYAPLKRFGKYVATLRSAEVLALEKRLRDDPRDAKAEKELDALKRDERHFVVSFHDTMGGAVRFKEENKDRYAKAEASEKEAGRFDGRAPSTEAFAAMLAALGVDESMDAATRARVEGIMENLYLETLGERDARLSATRRANRAGYDKDMMRSFVSHGRAQARLLAQMRHGRGVAKAMARMKEEARGDREGLQDVANVLIRKHANLMIADRGIAAGLQDAITSFNSMHMLTTNVAYHVANATQPAVSQARMAGDFGSYAGAWEALLRGYGDALRVVDGSFLRNLGAVLSAGVFETGNAVSLDAAKAKPAHRALLRTMQLRQLLDVGLEQDLNMESFLDTGYDSLNKVTKTFRDMSHRLYQSSRLVEAFNRVAVAVAAHDMARANPSVVRAMNMTPEEYAIAVVEDTQGNYSRMDAPLAIDALPRVTTQFRKFQIIMGWAWGSAARDAFKGADARERAAARRTLAYMGANLSALAGIRGVPFAGFVGSVALMAFGDEEEPADLERWARGKLGDSAVADLLMRGAPALLGVDLSAKLRQDDIFLPLNPEYIDTAPDAEPSRNIAFDLAFGPTAGTIGNIDRAMEHYARGNIGRAVEYLLPRGQPALETLRYATEGFQLKNGDVILDPSEIDLGQLARNALGLTPLEVSKMKWTYGQQIEIRESLEKRTARIRDDHERAREKGDREGMREARKEWRELQDAKDRLRPFFHDSRHAIPRQPASDLARTKARRERRERRAREALRGD